MKKISIITVCFNAQNEIRKTIESIVCQSFEDYEYIIIDGLSNDNTVNIINAFKDKISVFISEKDNGIFDAMNKGIEFSNSEWIIFMNAGDVFYNKDVLKDVFENKNFDNNIGYIFGNMSYWKNFKLCQAPCNPFFKNNSFIKPMGFSHQSVFIKTDLAKKFKFNLNYKLTSDYNMIIHIHKLGYQAQFIENNICIMDMNGISANNRILQYFEIAQIYNLDKTLKFKIFYLFKKNIINLKIFIKNYI